MIVLACHTISAVTYENLRRKVSIPMVEIIGSTVELAVQATRNRRIGVIGTETLINRDIYRKRLREKASFEVFNQACPLLMPLSEEG